MKTLNNLSEERVLKKRPYLNTSLWFYPEEDVKEFIRLLKGMIEFECAPIQLGSSVSRRLNSQIDKLAGGALNGKGNTI